MSIEELAKGAFNNVSFTPEKRGASFAAEFNSENSRIKYLCIKYDINPAGFLDKHEELAKSYLNAESRCASWAITGPANFPVRTMEKRANYAHYHLSRLCTFRENVEKTLIRLTRHKETEDDKKIKWQREIDILKLRHNLMKEVNALVRKGQIKEAETLCGFKLKPDSLGRVGFPAYKLQNNLSNIHRLEKQIKMIDRVRENKADSGFSFAGGRVDFDAQEIRYNVFFDEKPNEELRSKLKSRGFKWSPKRGAWTRGAKTINVNIIKSILGVA